MTNKFNIDKRRSPRIYFAAGAAVPIDVQLDHGHVILAADLLNLSTGGMQFSYNRQRFLHILEGDTLILKTIAGPVALAGLVGTTMVVRWVLNNVFFNYIAVGCEFVGLTDEQQNSLQQFVKSNSGNRHHRVEMPCQSQQIV
jgi:PilZ domain